MRIFVLVLFFNFNSYGLEALVCHTCAHLTHLSNGQAVQFDWLGSLILNSSCRYKEPPKYDLVQTCQNSDDICAAMFFWGNNQNSLAIRTCLPNVSISLRNKCTNFVDYDDKSYAKSHFKGLFNIAEPFSMQLCTCADDTCVPDNQRLNPYFERSFETLQTLNNLFKTYEKINNGTTTMPGTTTEIYNPESSTSTEPDIGNTITGRSESEESSESSVFPTTTSSSDETTGTATEYFSQVGYAESIKVPLVVWILVPAAGLVILVLIAITVLMKWKKRKPGDTFDEELYKFYNKEFLGNINRTTNSYGTYANEKFDVPISAYKKDIMGKPLWSDEYEVLHRGRIIKDGKSKLVALKSPKQQTNPQNILIAVRKLVQEMKVLSYIGTHENIIGFYGSHTEQLQVGKVCVFLELCSLGPLHTFLRKHKGKSDVSNSDLKAWAKQILKGMEYLASKHIAHADLRSSNIFLDSNKNAKISNLSFARNFLIKDGCSEQKLQPSSWQWMAPESLANWEFNEKTDVWAFGVTVWELYTFGEQPFRGLAWPSNFATQLERGFRLEKPKDSPEKIHKLMLQCWEYESRKRPNFNKIFGMLNELELL